MKLTNVSATRRRNRQTGMAAIMMLALLGLVLAFVFANMRALSDLRGELKVIEQKQIRRLNQPTTNAALPTPAMLSSNSPAAQTVTPPGQ